MLRRVTLFAVFAVGLATPPAAAADPDMGGYVHFGATVWKQADEAELFVLGTAVPGAGFRTDPGVAGFFEAGLFLKGGFAVAVSGMTPTHTSNVATGTIAGLGNLGDERVGFYSATGQYHFGFSDVITPYVGAGIGYMHIFGLTDGAVSGMQIDSALGAVVQAGVDVHIAENLSLFLDVKRYFIATSARGTLGGNAITANAVVDPWVIATGVGVGF